ncbi:MAG: hypothetical protein IJR99_15195 [Kiritimatiellae bacterium]|nr:hypothetical protein [Kiritimatiellia bacterium]
MFVTLLLAASLEVTSLPAPEYADCEVLTNCVFDVSQNAGGLFSLRIELDASPSNCVEVVFGHDTDGDGILSRREEGMITGWDCGEWKVVDCANGTETVCAGTPGRVRLDWRLYLGRDRNPRSLSAAVSGQPVFTELCQPPPPFLFDPAWNAAKIVRRGPGASNPRIDCSVDNAPITLLIR